MMPKMRPGMPGGKRPGLDLMIAVGKGGKRPGMPPPGDDELGEPDSLDPQDDEASESPEEESAEEYGSGLIEGIVKAGESRGMDPEESKGFASDIFRALADACGGMQNEEGGEEALPQSTQRGEYQG